jgi:hypothetical protein
MDTTEDAFDATEDLHFSQYNLDEDTYDATDDPHFSQYNLDEETSGSRHKEFGEVPFPEKFKKIFTDLAWKIRCNISDNTFNQLKESQLAADTWNFKRCKTELFNWSGIRCREYDCCRNGTVIHAYYRIIRILVF